MSRKAPAVASAHGTLAAMKRHHPDSPAIVGATRDLAAEKLADYVARIVGAAPPLTAEQLDRIACVLRTAGGGPDAAA
ncbi:MAG: hypothetical protein ACR2KG_13360 [Nocardioidaceae bacterium]